MLELRCAVLINCGATLNLIDDLEMENPNVVFYVVDRFGSTHPGSEHRTGWDSAATGRWT